MGEVYRATDTRLGREVALKVLPAAMASDPDRLARFEQEARAVAALNHPHIVTLYSVEEADGINFLTMELVEGDSLAAAIPDLDDGSFVLARQENLETIHQHSVVAERYGLLGEMRSELDSDEHSRHHVTMREWLERPSL